eukprot:8599142-Alexandrium_andersonii.AAC.1
MLMIREKHGQHALATKTKLTLKLRCTCKYMYTPHAPHSGKYRHALLPDVVTACEMTNSLCSAARRFCRKGRIPCLVST